MKRKKDMNKKQQFVFFLDMQGVSNYSPRQQADIPEWAKSWVFEVNKQYYPYNNFFFMDDARLEEIKAKIDHDRGQYLIEVSLNNSQFDKFLQLYFKQQSFKARRYIEKIANKDFESVTGKKDPYYASIYYQLDFNIDELADFFRGKRDLSMEQMAFLMNACPSMEQVSDDGGTEENVMAVFQEFERIGGHQLTLENFIPDRQNSAPDPSNFEQNDLGEVIHGRE